MKEVLIASNKERGLKVNGKKGEDECRGVISGPESPKEKEIHLTGSSSWL